MSKPMSFWILEDTNDLDKVVSVMRKINNRCHKWRPDEFARLAEACTGMLVVGMDSHRVIAVAEVEDGEMDILPIRGFDKDVALRCRDTIESWVPIEIRRQIEAARQMRVFGTGVGSPVSCQSA